MHISEGVLTPAILGAGYALSVAATCAGLRKMDYSRLTTAAVLSSVFFVGSLVHVPIGPGSVHLILNGLIGLFLGWGVFPAILVALLLQAVLFQFGGIAVLGVNTFNMAFPALLCACVFRPFMGGETRLRMAGAFCCGFFSVAGAALCTALALAVTDEGFLTSAKLLLLTHIPVMAVEGFITALAVSFIARSRPELLLFSVKRKGGAPCGITRPA
ncbi:MAG: cobalt transporter CbiM [Deltaproteobacteria bacterium]|nr:cobalt transporter CbiM [Deltaproteobacteria bacterium]